MRRNAALISCFVLCAAAHTSKAQDATILPFNQIAVVNDSVVAEGYRLYHYDKAQWVASDAYRELCSHKREAVVSIVRQMGDTALTTIFCDPNEKQCVFELRLSTGNVTEAIDQLRPLHPLEIEQLKHHMRLLNAVNAHTDSLTALGRQVGALNMDVVPLPDGITRVYFLQGTSRLGVIPFGNDCSMDFDRQCQMVGFRRYHPDFVPIDFSTAQTGSVHKTTHPHFEQNPFVTPTDVATFLLYGHDGYKMDTFSVYSRPLNCYFTFDARLGRVITIKDGQR